MPGEVAPAVGVGMNGQLGVTAELDSCRDEADRVQARHHAGCRRARERDRGGGRISSRSPVRLKPPSPSCRYARHFVDYPHDRPDAEIDGQAGRRPAARRP